MCVVYHLLFIIFLYVAVWHFCVFRILPNNSVKFELSCFICYRSAVCLRWFNCSYCLVLGLSHEGCLFILSFTWLFLSSFLWVLHLPALPFFTWLLLSLFCSMSLVYFALIALLPGLFSAFSMSVICLLCFKCSFTGISILCIFTALCFSSLLFCFLNEIFF